MYNEQNERTRAKGELKKQYAKVMTPSTSELCFVGSEVMFIICHGAVRTVLVRPPQPSYLTFHEPFAVSGDGKVIVGNSPESSRIWSCSSHIAEDAATKQCITYRKAAEGVTLSRVVCASDLVVLLSCDSGLIMDEYSSEEDDYKKPDFVAFLRWGPSHDISFNIFLALLMTALERKVSPTGKTAAGKIIYCDDSVRMSVCQIMLWVQEAGEDEDTFWAFLCANGIVLPGQDATNEDHIQIRGCIHTFGLVTDAESKKHDRLLVLEELL